MEESVRDELAVKAERSEARGVAAAGVERSASLATGVARGRDRGRWRLTEFTFQLSAWKTYSCFHLPTFQHFYLQ